MWRLSQASLAPAVINALKHAFPGERLGAIVVSFKGQNDDWTLAVKDDGVGMGAKARPVKSGLGTIIVQALAKQLHAHVRAEDAKPGCTVSVAHTVPVTWNDPGSTEPDLAAIATKRKSVASGFRSLQLPRCFKISQNRCAC